MHQSEDSNLPEKFHPHPRKEKSDYQSIYPLPIINGNTKQDSRKSKHLPKQDRAHHGQCQWMGGTRSRDTAAYHTGVYCPASPIAFHSSQIDQKTQKNTRKSRLLVRHHTISNCQSTIRKSSSTMNQRHQSCYGI